MAGHPCACAAFGIKRWAAQVALRPGPCDVALLDEATIKHLPDVAIAQHISELPPRISGTKIPQTWSLVQTRASLKAGALRKPIMIDSILPGCHADRRFAMACTPGRPFKARAYSPEQKRLGQLPAPRD